MLRPLRCFDPLRSCYVRASFEGVGATASLRDPRLPSVFIAKQEQCRIGCALPSASHERLLDIVPARGGQRPPPARANAPAPAASTGPPSPNP